MPEKSVVEELVANVGDLPAMPAIVSEVLRMTNDPSSDMSGLSDKIQSDPGLTAKILRVSNSSYYGMKQYVGTLKLALVILGVREVRNIVLGISVFETFKDSDGTAETLQETWERSLAIAAVARHLARAMGLGLQGEEFITGLLSDIGRLVLLRHMGSPYQAKLQEHGNDVAGLCAAEVAEVGCTHADLASALAMNWNLPPQLCDALWTQYPTPNRPLSDATDPALAAVVRIAKAAVIDEIEDGETLQCLSDSEAWGVLDTARNPLAESDREAFLLEYLEELKHVPKLPL